VAAKLTITKVIVAHAEYCDRLYGSKAWSPHELRSMKAKYGAIIPMSGSIWFIQQQLVSDKACFKASAAVENIPLVKCKAWTSSSDIISIAAYQR